MNAYYQGIGQVKHVTPDTVKNVRKCKKRTVDHVRHPPYPPKFIYIDIFSTQNIIFTKSHDNYHGYL